VPPLLSLTDDGQPPRPVVNISNVSSTPMSGLAHQIAEHAWFSELWSRTTERPLLIGESMDRRRFAVLDATDPRLADAEHPLNTALVTLGWKGGSDLQAWAEMTRERIQASERREATLADLSTAAAPIREQLRTSTVEVLGLIEPLREIVAMPAEHRPLGTRSRPRRQSEDPPHP
jgi:signal transduction histidine kinase